MAYGESKQTDVIPRGVMYKRVPGLRDIGSNSDCKVYKLINGVKTLVRIEKDAVL
jgi:hypothetical protein